jgi:FAD synthase
MIEIVSKRVSGNGLGSSIDFPTINFVLEKLPDGVDVGLWAISSRDGSGVSLISKEYTSKGSSILPVYRIETHILNTRYVNLSPGKDFKIFYYQNCVSIYYVKTRKR